MRYAVRGKRRRAQGTGHRAQGSGQKKSDQKDALLRLMKNTAVSRP